MRSHPRRAFGAFDRGRDGEELVRCPLPTARARMLLLRYWSAWHSCSVLLDARARRALLRFARQAVRGQGILSSCFDSLFRWRAARPAAAPHRLSSATRSHSQGSSFRLTPQPAQRPAQLARQRGLHRQPERNILPRRLRQVENVVLVDNEVLCRVEAVRDPMAVDGVEDGQSPPRRSLSRRPGRRNRGTVRTRTPPRCSTEPSPTRPYPSSRTERRPALRSGRPGT